MSPAAFLIMKLLSLTVRNQPPIANFAVGELRDTIVIAGPNGVGKTNLLNHILSTFRHGRSNSDITLVVEATCKAEIEAWGGAEQLSSNDPHAVQKLRGVLQKAKKRGQLRSGVLNFDASRVFETIQPYNFNWNFSDPFLEEIGWEQTLNSARARFQDVVHALYRKVRSQKEEIATQALQLQRQGVGQMTIDFPDPLKKFKEAFAKLLPGKRFCDVNEQEQQLWFMAGDKKLPFDRLSSGEREVVTVVFDFLLRDPRDSIIIFDEPELHLHPELSYRLLRTLRDAGERNQFIFCTHSADIISASLDQSVIFVAPASQPEINQAILVNEEHESAKVLHLLGQSVGVISLGRKIVLIEGTEASLDKQTYGAILGTSANDSVLVPTGGKDTIRSFLAAVETVLSKTIWGIDFYMLCDGDSAIGSQELKSHPRFKQLPRYHLENFFLEEDHLAHVFGILGEPDGSPFRDPKQIRSMLVELASQRTSHATALKVAHTIRLNCGNVDITPARCHEMTVDQLSAAFGMRAKEETSRISTIMDSSKIIELVRAEHDRVSSAIASGNGDWKIWVPGRPLLRQFAAKAKQDVTRLKTVYIREALSVKNDPFAEIRQIFQQFT